MNAALLDRLKYSQIGKQSIHEVWNVNALKFHISTNKNVLLTRILKKLYFPCLALKKKIHDHTV